MMLNFEKKSVKLSPHAWKKLVQEAFKRDGFHCQICYSPAGLHPHHIIPKGRLRLDILCNILTLCHQCHRRLHGGKLLDITIDSLIDKYKLREYLK